MNSEQSVLQAGLHTIPIKSRPSPSFLQRIQFCVFLGCFLTALVLDHAVQLVMLPLYIPPFRPVFKRAICHTKEVFAVVLVVLNQFFGPSTIVLTAGQGVSLDEMCIYDAQGRVSRLHLAHHSVWMANHQCYIDWIITWLMLTVGKVSSGIIIILKASLRWAPIVGPAMQLFDFIFVSKKRKLQEGALHSTAVEAVKTAQPFALVIFPEGTLVSALTRPKSASFAAATGVKDLENLLLPRSTGLLYCLRTLSLDMPDLTLYDVTIGYKGVPAGGYAQDYYTLKSIYGYGISPPRIHVHLSKLALKDVPIGHVREGATKEELDVEVTAEERAVFQEWTLGRWQDKDELLRSFYQHGAFPAGKQGSREMRVHVSKTQWATLASVPFTLALVAFAVARLL